MDNGRETAGTGVPVKIVLQRRAHPGRGEALDRWVRDLLDVASRSGELEGSSVLTTGNGEYFILLRFSSQRQLERWASSPRVLELMHTGDEHSFATDVPVQRSGLETWFTLPGAPAPNAPPPRWKMALITWLALLPQALALSFLLPSSWPKPLGVAAGTAIPVAVLTWFAMPHLTKLLYRWLYGPQSGDAAPSGRGSGVPPRSAGRGR